MRHQPDGAGNQGAGNKNARNAVPRPEAEQESEQTKGWRQVAEYSGLAVAMPIATVIGYAAGRWVDGQMGTAIFWLIGLVLGVAAGFLQLIRKAVKDANTQTN